MGRVGGTLRAAPYHLSPAGRSPWLAATPLCSPPGPSVSLQPQLPRRLLLLSSKMKRCERYGDTRDRLAGKMDEGAGGQ